MAALDYGHPAGPNFGDMTAYAIAKLADEPLIAAGIEFPGGLSAARTRPQPVVTAKCVPFLRLWVCPQGGWEHTQSSGGVRLSAGKALLLHR